MNSSARIYEIHRLRVEDTQAATSVVEHVQGMAINGTGYVSGRTDTLHHSNLFANDKAYSLVEVTSKVPIRRGDDLIVVCLRAKNGAWNVCSVANRSNGTSYKHGPFLALVYGWVGFLGAVLSILLFIGIVLAPLMLYWAARFTLRNLPELLAANRAAGAIARLRTDDEITRAIQAFNASPPDRLLRFGPLHSGQTAS